MATPLTWTMEAEVNPAPVRVMVLAGSPRLAVFGVKEVSAMPVTVEAYGGGGGGVVDGVSMGVKLTERVWVPEVMMVPAAGV